MILDIQPLVCPWNVFLYDFLMIHEIYTSVRLPQYLKNSPQYSYRFQDASRKILAD